MAEGEGVEELMWRASDPGLRQWTRFRFCCTTAGGRPGTGARGVPIGVAVGVVSAAVCGAGLNEVTGNCAVLDDGKPLDDRLDDREEVGETGLGSEVAGRSSEMPDGSFDLPDFGGGGSVAIDDPIADPEPDAEAPDEGSSLTKDDVRLGDNSDDRSGSKSRPKLEVELEGNCPRASVPVEAKLCGKMNPEGAATLSSPVADASAMFESV